MPPRMDPHFRFNDDQERDPILCLRDIRREALRTIRPVRDGDLSTNIDLADTPDFLRGTFCLIQPDEGDDAPTHFKKLMKLVSYNEVGHLTSLMVGAALFGLANPGFTRDLRAILRVTRSNIIPTTLGVFVDAYQDLADCEYQNIDELGSMEAAHYVFALSIIANLIGKQLDEKNATQWLTKRTRSYSNPLGLRHNDPLLADLLPSRQFASAFYSDVKVYWEVRRLFFLNIHGMSLRGDLLARGMTITMTLLRGAEMTNWLFISYWITQLNPDLLMWNELGKYLPAICSAYAKYTSVGPLRDWLKLILPPSDVTEFRTDKLQVVYTVAKAIASKYGNSSIDQVEGENKQNAISSIVNHALYIVRTSGGARTVDGMAIRNWRYGAHKNDDVIHLLDRGASVVPDVPLEQEERDVNRQIN